MLPVGQVGVQDPGKVLRVKLDQLLGGLRRQRPDQRGPRRVEWQESDRAGRQELLVGRDVAVGKRLGEGDGADHPHLLVLLGVVRVARHQLLADEGVGAVGTDLQCKEN